MLTRIFLDNLCRNVMPLAKAATAWVKNNNNYNNNAQNESGIDANKTDGDDDYTALRNAGAPHTDPTLDNNCSSVNTVQI